MKRIRGIFLILGFILTGTMFSMEEDFWAKINRIVQQQCQQPQQPQYQQSSGDAISYTGGSAKGGISVTGISSMSMKSTDEGTKLMGTVESGNVGRIKAELLPGSRITLEPHSSVVLNGQFYDNETNNSVTYVVSPNGKFQKQ